MLYRIFGLALLTIFQGSCEAVEDFVEQPEHKTITISDSDPDWTARISDINDKTIILALMPLRPTAADITPRLFRNFVYAMGKVTRNKIHLKLYKNRIEYWTGTGSYWVVFVLPDENATHISLMYVSKQAYGFYTDDTYLTNIDFMPPVDIDLETKYILPF